MTHDKDKPENQDKSAQDHDQNSDDNKGKSAEQSHKERKSVSEIVFSLFSIGVICALCIYLVVQSQGEPLPPAFRVQPGYPASRGDFVAVDVAVFNDGDQTAKALVITGTMPKAGNSDAEAEATLNWLPGNSKRLVTLLFPADVETTATPEIQLLGYEKP